MSSYVSKYVVCPFYRRHNDNRICCEGTDESNTINLVFIDSKEQKRYSRDLCGSISGYVTCPIYQTLIANKYTEEGCGGGV